MGGVVRNMTHTSKAAEVTEKEGVDFTTSFNRTKGRSFEID